MKKFGVILATLVAICAFVPPADAAVSKKCPSAAFQNATVCVSITYGNQGDGTGFVFQGAATWADVGPLTKDVTVSIKVRNGNGVVVWANGNSELNPDNSWSRTWNPTNQAVNENAYWEAHIVQEMKGDHVIDYYIADILGQLN